MDFLASDNDNFQVGIPQIKKDIMKVIEYSNRLKQKLQSAKLHFIELDSVLERGINIFLHATHAQAAHESGRAIAPPLEDFLMLRHIVDCVTGFCQAQLNVSKEFDFQHVSEEVYVNVDYKYFARALEYLVERMAAITSAGKQVKISTVSNYNQSILIIYDGDIADLRQVEDVCRVELLQELLKLQGIVLEARVIKGRNCAVMRIPAYRVYGQIALKT